MRSHRTTPPLRKREHAFAVFLLSVGWLQEEEQPLLTRRVFPTKNVLLLSRPPPQLENSGGECPCHARPACFSSLFLKHRSSRHVADHPCQSDQHQHRDTTRIMCGTLIPQLSF